MRWVAFLRGINLGNRRMTMDRLREVFEEKGLERVDTYLASGNVLFEDPRTEAEPLERSIEAHLADALGYPVDTFLRPLDELGGLCELPAVVAAEGDGFTPHVIFLREAPGPGVRESLSALETPDDRFRTGGREVFWLRRGGISTSSIRTRDLEKALGGSDNTMRNLRTVRRIVRKFGAG